MSKQRVRNVKNAPRFYRTTVSATAWVGKMTALLTEFGCDSFIVENFDGRPSGIAFQWRGLAYRIRPDVDAMAGRLNGNRAAVAPAAVAWAQAYHLLEMQLEAVETGAAKVSEVLGGYVLMENGCTVGDMIEERASELMPGSRLLLPGEAR